MYGNHTPALGLWTSRFNVPSVLSIAVPYFMLRWSQRHDLQGEYKSDLDNIAVSSSGRIALGGICGTATVLLIISAFDMQLGLPTAILGALTAAIGLIQECQSPWPIMKAISWSVLRLVAGFFVLVKMLQHTGVIAHLARVLQIAVQHDETTSAAVSGEVLAIASNLMNNCRRGLIASSALMQAHNRSASSMLW